eukprot:gene41496-biopygen33059
MVEAYRQLSAVTDAPLHLGVTEAGPPPAGLVKATAGIATLLMEGIGDTIRYSLTADPVEEARAGRQLLEALGLREHVPHPVGLALDGAGCRGLIARVAQDLGLGDGLEQADAGNLRGGARAPPPQTVALQHS